MSTPTGSITIDTPRRRLVVPNNGSVPSVGEKLSIVGVPGYLDETIVVARREWTVAGESTALSVTLTCVEASVPVATQKEIEQDAWAEWNKNRFNKVGLPTLNAIDHIASEKTKEEIERTIRRSPVGDIVGG